MDRWAPWAEQAEIFKARYDEAVAEFQRRGPEGVHIFRASLKALRFTPRDIEAEVGLHWPVRKEGK